MKKLVKLVGMTFAKKDHPALEFDQPAGEVEFVQNTQYDKPTDPKEFGGVQVMFGGIRIGWLGKGTGPQVEMNAIINASDEPVFGTITECDYASRKPWCEVRYDGIGEEMVAADDKVDDDKNFEFYVLDGERYDRVSTVAERFDPTGAKGVDGQLTRWMIDSFGSHAEYKGYMTEKADAGTAGHKGIEIGCKHGVIGADETATIEAAVRAIPKGNFDTIPFGFWNFVKDHTSGMKMLGTEEIVYDKQLMVAGTYDFLGGRDEKKILIDWKTSKNVTLSHMIKTCFYAYLKNADEVWVLALGSKNKCGYQVKKAGRLAIKAGYQIICNTKNSIDLCLKLKDLVKAGV